MKKQQTARVQRLLQPVTKPFLFRMPAMRSSIAENGNEADLGEREFEKNCSVCHGSGGHGDGPYAGLLNVPLPDLTTLSQRNSGVFPFQRVYDTVEGTQMVKGHGTKRMPIWGQAYAYDAESDFFTWRAFPWDAEAFVRARILALTEYVGRLQVKSEGSK